MPTAATSLVPLLPSPKPIQAIMTNLGTLFDTLLVLLIPFIQRFSADDSCLSDCFIRCNNPTTISKRPETSGISIRAINSAALDLLLFPSFTSCNRQILSMNIRKGQLVSTEPASSPTAPVGVEIALEGPEVAPAYFDKLFPEGVVL